MATWNAEYYCHRSTGTLMYEPGKGTKHYVPWWAIVRTDPGIIDLYCWLSRRYGKPITQNKLWGPHISGIKGEEPKNMDAWGKDFGEIEFWYSNVIRYDNGMHAWLDIWSPMLHDIREQLGLPAKIGFGGHPRHFHMTLGRWND